MIAVLPETLAIDASLDAERRQRGIYEAMVYTSQIALKGRFAPPDLAVPPGRAIDVHWEDATLAIGVSAPVGIHDVDTPRITGGARSAEPGSQLAALPQGMHWRLLDAKALANNGEFSIDVSLHGSAQIAFAPIGATTRAHIASKWPHPGFIGVMPTQRAIDASGFSADWSVSSLSRSYPQMFSQSSAPQSLNEVSLGVRLVQPVFLYSLNDRAVKYAVLFVTLTFVTLLVFELVTDARVHYVQYALIGAALTMFYLLLLAFSEHVGFGAAYAIAASTVVAMITTYTAAALGRWRRAVADRRDASGDVCGSVRDSSARRLRVDHRHHRVAGCAGCADVLHEDAVARTAGRAVGRRISRRLTATSCRAWRETPSPR